VIPPDVRLAGEALQERELTSDRMGRKLLTEELTAPEAFAKASTEPLTTGRRPDMPFRHVGVVLKELLESAHDLRPFQTRRGPTCLWIALRASIGSFDPVK
jgi:hypothetical protein